MPDVSTETPAEGSYAHVLINPRLNPNLPYFEALYNEVVTARSIEWPFRLALPFEPRSDLQFYPRKKGDRVSMMFVRSPDLRTRLTGLGWVDVTEAWKSRLAEAAPSELPPLNVGAPVGESKKSKSLPATA